MPTAVATDCAVGALSDEQIIDYWRTQTGCGFVATPYFSALALPCGLYIDFLLPF